MYSDIVLDEIIQYHINGTFYNNWSVSPCAMTISTGGGISMVNGELHVTCDDSPSYEGVWVFNITNHTLMRSFPINYTDNPFGGGYHMFDNEGIANNGTFLFVDSGSWSYIYR